MIKIPNEKDNNYPQWIHLLALSDDTLAQFSTLLVNFCKNVERVQHLLTLLTINSFRDRMLTDVWQKQLYTDRQIRQALQRYLLKFSLNYYPQLRSFLPKEWGNGHRIINAGLGLI